MSRFVEISKETFPAMLKFLKHELPRSAMFYNVLRLKMALEGNHRMKFQLFVYGNDDSIYGDNTDSIFLAAKIRVEKLPQTLVVLLNPQNPSQEMLNALDHIINWNEMNQFEAIENSCANFLGKLCEAHGKAVIFDPIELYYMEKDKALSFDENKWEGKDIQVKTLNPSDAIKINNVWPAACPGSLEMITASIDLIGSGGVYVHEGDHWELASWIVALPFGSIHALHTKPQYQQRGYAGLTIQIVSKVVAENGRIPVVQIFKTNDTSKSVNQRVGFVYSHDINLIHYHPI